MRKAHAPLKWKWGNFEINGGDGDDDDDDDDDDD